MQVVDIIARLPPPLGTSSEKKSSGLNSRDLLRRERKSIAVSFNPLAKAEASVGCPSSAQHDGAHSDALRAAFVLFRKLPIALDQDGRVHFHSLLQVS